MKQTLVVMAAGMGSRFGGIKQLAPVGPSGEIIMDYSVYDAVKAGFNRVVFIIRKDLEKDFKDVIGDRISSLVETAYVFQDIGHLPAGAAFPKGRKKPWGTGHAVMSCLGVVNEPFAVINADDYYGREGFKAIHDFLEKSARQKTGTASPDSPESNKKYSFCMAGFELGNTLSENGTVSRGVCQVKDGILEDIVETYNIKREGNQASGTRGESKVSIPLNQPVSMNMWGFTPEFLMESDRRFAEFLRKPQQDLEKAEFFLPKVVDELIKEGKAEVSVLPTKDKWFGVTYKEDREYVSEAFKRLVREGIYPERLY